MQGEKRKITRLPWKQKSNLDDYQILCSICLRLEICFQLILSCKSVLADFTVHVYQKYSAILFPSFFSFRMYVHLEHVLTDQLHFQTADHNFG